MSDLIQHAQAAHGVRPRVINVIEDLTIALRLAGTMDPRRVATDIMAALLDVSRSWPLMNQEAAVAPIVVASANAAARKIAQGAPFAYAVGSASFRNLTLLVDERVLIPRPETEVLVSEILERMRDAFRPDQMWGAAADIGTGSGAIALSLASEGRFERMIATDASTDALNVARENLARSSEPMRGAVEFRCGSLVAPLQGECLSLLVSNPPYVAFSEIELLPPAVRDWEPPLALLSGHDGMSATARIISEGPHVLSRGGILALEVDERRASLVAELIMRNGAYSDIGVRLDLAGRERFVFATRT